ncbi:hypothetical protein DNTS_018076 [Danionella cerebrum]|uniref:Uncharacterized protein n=1 Tax=Danionella cerebrum TaxID=2873325 RepID=A0A553QGU5_9TELE|nr:hypothetical protein DNTS_018076 [Danionella translucida]
MDCSAHVQITAANFPARGDRRLVPRTPTIEENGEVVIGDVEAALTGSGSGISRFDSGFPLAFIGHKHTLKGCEGVVMAGPTVALCCGFRVSANGQQNEHFRFKRAFQSESNIILCELASLNQHRTGQLLESYVSAGYGTLADAEQVFALHLQEVPLTSSASFRDPPVVQDLLLNNSYFSSTPLPPAPSDL